MNLTLDLNWAEPDFRLAVRGAFDITGITALFGPSGAGKSSVLNALAGFLPNAGSVIVDDEVWQEAGAKGAVPPYLRPVGTVFQEPRLFPHLDVAGNLSFAEKRANPEGPQIAFDEVIAVLQIGDLMDRSSTTLSGGEARRVAIARALMSRPKLLLMDEPLSGIDRERKNVILQMIGRLPLQFGVPVIFVSHLVEEVAHISDQLIALQAGRVVGHGPTAAMLERLGAEVTGHFDAGSLVEGEVVEWRDDLSMIALQIGSGILWMPSSLTVAIGERLRVRLRARDVSLSLAPLSDVSIRNQLPVRILSIDEEEGPFAELRLDCGGQILRARLTRLAVQDLKLNVGDDAFALIKSVAFDRRLGASFTA